MAQLDREARMTIEALSQRGVSNRETARLLNVTEGAIRYHRRRQALGMADGRSRQRALAADFQEAISAYLQGDTNESEPPAASLLPFAGALRESDPSACLPYSFADYLELVDWTGRAIRDGKRGHIPHELPPILQRLNLAPAQWLKAAAGIEEHFFYAIGPVAKLQEFCAQLNRRWIQGTRACRKLYQRPPCPA